MACEFELLFNMHQYKQAGSAALAAFQLIDDLEDQLTVYRDHSEVSQINQSAFEREVTVETGLFGLLKLATEIHEQTDGAFDITSGALSKIWGFEKRAGVLPDQNLIDAALATVGMHLVELNDASQRIRFSHPDVSINLGGIGKGHALDRVAKVIETENVNDFVIHGGQSSVLARGSSTVNSNPEPEDPPPSNQDGWIVGLTHPTLPSVRLAEVVLRNQALGTSGTGRQGFYHHGKRYGHIIDPRTGWPTSHFLSTTVITPSAALSDALATAFFVMTLEQVEAYCNTQPDISAICVTQNSSMKAQVELHEFNLSDRDWNRLQ